MLKLALGPYDAEMVRAEAITALRFDYDDAMAAKLVPLLKDDNRWVRLNAAWLLAWAGHDDGVAVLVEAAGKTPENGSAYAAGALSYLPDTPAAVDAFRNARTSKDKDFRDRLQSYLQELLPPARGKEADPDNGGAANAEKAAKDNQGVPFLPKVHEGLLLVDYKVEVDGMNDPAVFKKGTPIDLPIRVQGEPVLQKNGRVRVVVHTRSNEQDSRGPIDNLEDACSVGRAGGC
jgi:hypothetical protein